MRLWIASEADLARVEALWHHPDNLSFIDPPAADEIAETQANRHLLLWGTETEAIGFAAFTQWLPAVYGLRAFGVTLKGQGRPFLHAALSHCFEVWKAHRIGLDVTADNHRALRFFKAAGFVQEGIWRQCWQRPEGDWVDCHFFGLLASDPRS